MDPLPPPAGGPGLALLTARTWNAIRAILARPELTPDPTQFDSITRGKKRTFRLRRFEEFIQSLGTATHPFKATPNGDATITIAPGLLTTYRDNGDGDLSDPFSLTAYFVESAAGTVTATAAEGWAYLLCNLETVIVAADTLPGSIPFLSERQIYDPTVTPSLVYSSTSPATYNPQSNTPARNFAIPIAKVALAGGVASVDTQYVKADLPPIGGSYTYEPTP